MKIAFITYFEILGPQNTGGIQSSKKNLSLLRQVFGEKNVFLFAITKNKEYLSKGTENTFVIYSNRSEKMVTLKNGIGAFFGRERFGKKAESEVLKHILHLGCSAVWMDNALMGFLPKRLPNELKKILFMTIIEVDNVRHRPRSRLISLLLLLPTMLNESRAVKNADVIITLNKRDSTLLSKYYNRRSDLELPITFDDRFEKSNQHADLSTQTSLQLLFVGSLFMPNEVGITWLVDNVMPYVNAELTVVGKDMEKLATRLNRENVKVIGSVDDVSQYLYRANAVVSPIFSGGGMKVKTAEALMYGKPMFATDEALEGYEVEGQKNIFRCNTPQEFIAAINTYAENTPYVAIDEDLRAYFLLKHHTPNYIPVLRELLMK